jgi:hypothetical protein
MNGPGIRDDFNAGFTAGWAWGVARWIFAFSPAFSRGGDVASPRLTLAWHHNSMTETGFPILGLAAGLLRRPRRG